jgi:hypothetical protein
MYRSGDQYDKKNCKAVVVPIHSRHARNRGPVKISAGMAAGFAAGVAIVGGALTWLRVQENVTRDREAAHVAELDAQVQRLEQTVSRLADEIASNKRITQVLPTAAAATTARMVLPPDTKLTDSSSSPPQ